MHCLTCGPSPAKKWRAGRRMEVKLQTKRLQVGDKVMFHGLVGLTRSGNSGTRVGGLGVIVPLQIGDNGKGNKVTSGTQVGGTGL